MTAQEEGGFQLRHYQKFDDQNRSIQEWSELEDVPNGVWRAWLPSGALSFEVTLENGLEEDELRMWDETGRLTQSAWLENGVLHGHFRCWWASGQIKEEGEYIQGKRVAPYIGYDQDGRIVQTYPE